MTKQLKLAALSLNVYTSNDTQALGQLYEYLAPVLRSHLYWLGANKEEADDILIDTFLRGWEGLRRKHIRYVCSYFQRAVRNGYYNRRRVRGNHQRLVSRVEEMYAANRGIDLTPLDLMSLEQETAEIQAALNRLTEHHRQPLLLFYFEQLSYQEIAATLNVPLGTAMSRLHRAKQALHAILTERPAGE